MNMMASDVNKCPICGFDKDFSAEFCSQCGWEFRHYLVPLTGEFLELEQRRLAASRQKWLAAHEEIKVVEAPLITYSYGILVLYRGEKCVSNMVFSSDPVLVSRELPVGKFKTQMDHQPSITIPIYRNQSNEEIVPVEQCEKVMEATITLDTNALSGTPIVVRWERLADNILMLRVKCLDKESIVRL